MLQKVKVIYAYLPIISFNTKNVTFDDMRGTLETCIAWTIQKEV